VPHIASGGGGQKTNPSLRSVRSLTDTCQVGAVPSSSFVQHGDWLGLILVQAARHLAGEGGAMFCACRDGAIVWQAIEDTGLPSVELWRSIAFCLSSGAVCAGCRVRARSRPCETHCSCVAVQVHVCRHTCDCDAVSRCLPAGSGYGTKCGQGIDCRAVGRCACAAVVVVVASEASRRITWRCRRRR